MLAQKIGEFKEDVYLNYSSLLENTFLDYRLADKILRIGKVVLEAEGKRLKSHLSKINLWIDKYKDNLMQELS